MKKNMGRADQIIRILLALTAGILFFTNTVTGTIGWVIIIAGAILLLTSFVNFCPIYSILGLRTRPKAE